MAKKIAAPSKAARKTPAGKKASTKKVTAPKTHKPKGAPKEKLAYLNKGEMAALSKRKGSGPVRGPKGIPSFVETSGTKSAGSISDSYKGTGGGWNSSNATRSGNTSGVGGGGGGGGGATGSRGSSSGSVGAGNGSNAGRGQGGQGSGTRGAGSNYGPGSGRPGTSSQASGNRGAGSNYGPGSNSPGIRANTAAPRGMVGTPRGYVNRQDRDRVDRDMQPVAAIGKELPYFTPGVGPLAGAVMKAAVPAVRMAAAPAVRAISAAVRPSSLTAAEKVAQEAALEAYRAKAAAAGRVPGEMAVSMRSLPVTANQRAAIAKGPGVVEKGLTKLEDATDYVTNRMGYGVGDVARAKASAATSAAVGFNRGAYDAYNRATSGNKKASSNSGASKKGDRSSNGVAGGKTNRGGYRSGGSVKRTFKNK